LLDPVLDDYQRGVPDARDAEVLLLLSEIIAKLGLSLIERGHIQRIFESVFQVTLDMITKNFEDYPDHRLVRQHETSTSLPSPLTVSDAMLTSVVWLVCLFSLCSISSVCLR